MSNVEKFKPCKLCDCGGKAQCEHCKEHLGVASLEDGIAAKEPDCLDHMNQGYASIVKCDECGGKMFTHDWWEQYCSGCFDLHWKPVHQVEQFLYNRIFSFAVKSPIRDEDLHRGNKFDGLARRKLAEQIMEIISKAEEVKKVTGKYSSVIDHKNEPADVSYIYKRK